MALFHFTVTQTKRSKGQSAIASAAYRSGEKLYSEYYGEYSDYTRKRGVICSDILLPPHAPKEYADRQTLWNAVEKAERGNLSRFLSSSSKIPLVAFGYLSSISCAFSFFAGCFNRLLTFRRKASYAIDENTRTQTVVVNPNDTQTLHFYNTPIGGVEIIKVNEDNHSERIPNTTFEIRKVDDALVDTVTTDKNGRVFVALEDGSYYAKEVTSNKSFRLDDTPHYFEIKDGKRVTLQVTNKKLSGIVIHKIDSATGEGIYGVKFVLYDANKKPIGEYTSDDEGYIYIDEIPGGLSGRFYLRELEAAPGYTLDKQYKTVYVSPGKTVEIEWENTAVTGQIQIYKYAAEYNEVTGTAAGTPLKGAVYEIVNARSGKVVDYITTDARGVAASKPLPLTRYQIREVTAPAYWQLDPTVHDVTLEYPGQIIKLSAYDKPSSLGVTITKRGNAQVMAGQSMRYDLTVANTSNVPLESFFWHDKIPYEYLARLSEERNMSCIGATNYGSRQITVSSAGATVHEFGHFLDELMGFPSQTEGFYQEESGTAAALLRPYALTNEREYFADCFVYWLTYRDNSKKMAALCSAAPKTYAYLLALESQNWQPAA